MMDFYRILFIVADLAIIYYMLRNIVKILKRGKTDTDQVDETWAIRRTGPLWFWALTVVLSLVVLALIWVLYVLISI